MENLNEELVTEDIISVPPDTYIIIPGTGVQISHDSPSVKAAYTNGNSVRLTTDGSFNWYASATGGR